MKAIVIDQAKWDDLWERVKDELALENLTSGVQAPVDMHRRFIYHIFMLKDRVEKS